MMMIWSTPNLPWKSFWWAKTKCHLRIYCKKRKINSFLAFYGFPTFIFEEKVCLVLCKLPYYCGSQLNFISVWRLTLHAAYMSMARVGKWKVVIPEMLLNYSGLLIALLNRTEHKVSSTCFVWSTMCTSKGSRYHFTMLLHFYWWTRYAAFSFERFLTWLSSRLASLFVFFLNRISTITVD